MRNTGTQGREQRDKGSNRGTRDGLGRQAREQEANRRNRESREGTGIQGWEQGDKGESR